METYPEPPAPPSVPPADVNVPDTPPVEAIFHPKPVEPEQLMKDDTGTQDNKSLEPLGSKLKEVEKE
jgi:hypothetical protein